MNDGTETADAGMRLQQSSRLHSGKREHRCFGERLSGAPRSVLAASFIHAYP